MMQPDMRRNRWVGEARTGRELVQAWVDQKHGGNIAAAGRALGLGRHPRQRLWGFLRQGIGLGEWDELRVARMLGIPFEAVVMADTPIGELMDPQAFEQSPRWLN